MPFTSHQGIRIHYRVEGAGPPIVLYHGITYSLDSWYDMGYVASLKQSRTVISLDARGHGASDKPHEPSAYAATLQAADVLAVLDALDIGQADFFGYSLGGRVGFTLAQHAPSRLSSLVIAAASPFPFNRAALSEWQQQLRQGMRAFVDWWEQSEVLPGTLKERVLINDNVALVALCTQMTQDPSAENVLTEMKMPCLLYAGECDARYAGVKAAAEQIPNARFVSLEKLTHTTSFVRSDLVLPHVNEFLRTACTIKSPATEP